MICHLTRSLWETPEVTTAAMAVGQLQMSLLTHRFAAVAQLQRLTQGSVYSWKSGYANLIAARLLGLWLTPDLFRLRRVT